MPDKFTRRAETACCLWEEFLALRLAGRDYAPQPGWKGDFISEWEAWGTCHMRMKAISLTDLCDQTWGLLSPDEQDAYGPFDWEFVPAFVSMYFQHPTDSASQLANHLTGEIISNETALSA